MNYPENLRYSQDHEWVRAEGNLVVVGITDYAQDALGDIVYVELPPLGKELKVKEEFGVAESVKSVSSLYAPISGKVVARNEALDKQPQLVNDSPYDQGWMIKVELNNSAELEKLLSAADYQKQLK